MRVFENNIVIVLQKRVFVKNGYAMRKRQLLVWHA